MLIKTDRFLDMPDELAILILPSPTDSPIFKTEHELNLSTLTSEQVNAEVHTTLGTLWNNDLSAEENFAEITKDLQAEGERSQQDIEKAKILIDRYHKEMRVCDVGLLKGEMLDLYL